MQTAAKHRTQISLEDWQYQKLLEISRKSKKSLSSIIRDSLTERFSRQAGKAGGKDSILGIVGLGAGDGSPAARQHDRFLYTKKKKR